jgi:hypothetical protein
VRAEPSVSLPASNGFHLEVSGSASGLFLAGIPSRVTAKVLPSKLPPGLVAVFVSKGDSASVYLVPGAVTAHRLRARLGASGGSRSSSTGA